ncbi:hypothetical protein [Bacteroides nordii]|uniref:hypothetical protein n=1 Tax=Bacteroides nordii TaxID=291645 RepID=UPI001897A21A|nr:hypothetical protein [Bacteroides nordii]
MRKDLLQLGMLIDKAKSLNDVPKIREYLDILKNYVTNDLRHNEKSKHSKKGSIIKSLPSLQIKK